MVARYEEMKQRNEDLQQRLDDVESKCVVVADCFLWVGVSFTIVSAFGVGRYDNAREDAEEAQLEAALGRKQVKTLTARLDVRCQDCRLQVALSGAMPCTPCPCVGTPRVQADVCVCVCVCVCGR